MEGEDGMGWNNKIQDIAARSIGKSCVMERKSRLETLLLFLSANASA